MILTKQFFVCLMFLAVPYLPAQSAQTAAVEDDPATMMEGTGPAVPVTLADALRMAERGNPRLREAQAATEQARAGERTARAYSNPSLEIYEGQQYARPIATPAVPGLLQHYEGYQPIEIPTERAARRRTAEFVTSGSRAAGQALGLSVAAEVKHAFYAALRQREEIDHARENLALVQDLFRRVQVEVDVGEKGGLELTRAEAELAGARFAVRRGRLQYADAIASLRLAIAAPPDVNLDPRGDLAPRITLPPMSELRDKVLQNHPVVAQSLAENAAARSSLDRERALRIPQPTAFAEFENQPDLRFWRVGVLVPLPIFDRRRGQIDAARAAVDRSTALLSQRRLELSSALERAYQQYELADEQVTSLESGSLRAAEQAVAAAQAAYRFGERGIVEVLDAQRVLQNTRGELLDARFARQSALVNLEELGAVTPVARP